MNLKLATMKDEEEIQEFLNREGRIYTSLIKEALENEKVVIAKKRQEFKGFIFILEENLSNGKKVGKIKNLLDMDVFLSVEKDLIKWILDNKKKYDEIVLYSFPINRRDYYESLGIKHRETLIKYIVSFQNFKKYDIKYEVEKADIKDLNEIYEVDCAAFDVLWHNSKKTIASIIEKNEEDNHFVVIRKGEKIAAIGSSNISKEDGIGYIGRIAILPEFQGMGYGKSILEDALNWMYSKNMGGAMLNTQVNNVKSRPLYEKHGFMAIEENYVYEIK